MYKEKKLKINKHEKEKIKKHEKVKGKKEKNGKESAITGRNINKKSKERKKEIY